MKKRYIYALLFGIPGLFVAGIVSALGFGALAGILWIYVFGDNPWPAAAEQAISLLFVIVVVTLWLGFSVAGYLVGKRLEHESRLNRRHVLISAGLTALFLLAILFQQLSVGNLGPQSESALCSEFCTRHGYAASGLPPRDSGERICRCYDSSGNEVLVLPLDHIQPQPPR